jgi:hypothetical protein
MALVIKEWTATETPKNGIYIRIKGREAGVLSWLLSLIGVDPTTTLTVNDDNVLFEQGSLSGFSRRVIPLKSVCSGFYGYSKPWKEAVILGGLLAIPTFGIAVIVAIIYYYLNKQLTMGVVEVSGIASSISFKRSVIEGRQINETDGANVIHILEKRLKAASDGVIDLV